MKGLLKTAVLLATFCAIAMACGGSGEDALDQKGDNGGGTICCSYYSCRQT